jgi:hypothetical protein
VEADSFSAVIDSPEASRVIEVCLLDGSLIDAFDLQESFAFQDDLSYPDPVADLNAALTFDSLDTLTDSIVALDRSSYSPIDRVDTQLALLNAELLAVSPTPLTFVPLTNVTFAEHSFDYTLCPLCEVEAQVRLAAKD